MYTKTLKFCLLVKHNCSETCQNNNAMYFRIFAHQLEKKIRLCIKTLINQNNYFRNVCIYHIVYVFVITIKYNYILLKL